MTTEGLLREYADTRDPDLKKELAVRYLDLVHYVARRFKGRGIGYEDLVQAGSAALMGALERYDPRRGSAFPSFAIPSIVGELKRYFRDYAWCVRVPRRLKDLSRRVVLVTDQLTADLGRAPRPEEVAAALGVTEEQVLAAREIGEAYHPQPLHRGRTDEAPAPAVFLGEEDRALATVEDRLALRRAMDRLSEPEQRVVFWRYFQELPQSQVARHLGVSQMQVSRMERRALGRMRGVFSARM